MAYYQKPVDSVLNPAPL